MKYLLKESLSRIKEYKIFKDYLATTDSENTISLDNNILCKTEEDFFFINDKFYYQDNDSTLEIDLISKTSKILKFLVSNVGLYQNTFLRGIDYKREENGMYSSKLLLYQFNPPQLLHEIPNRHSLSQNISTRFKNKLIGCFSRTIIKSLNLETGKYHWEVDLSEYCKYSSVATSYQIVEGMIREVFGVFEDKIWVYTDARLLLGLSLQTGQVLLKIDTNKFHSGGFVFFAAHFLPQEGIIGFLIEQHYLEYDLRTLTVIKEKNFDTGQHLTDWKFSLSTFTNDYIYFVGNKGSEYGFSQFVGVLNRKNLEVEWWQNMGEGNKTPYFSLTKAPLSDGKKLYVHDSEGTLHIFEKTEDN
jgi:hypothetical protein